MRYLVLAWLLVFGFGCRKPEPVVPPRVKLMVRFLDRDALLEMATVPPEGAWHLMNAGLWEPLEIRWQPGAPRLGAVVVGRTAPDWVLLEDPGKDTHRIVMRGPGPEELAQRNERLDPEERDALEALGLLWVLTWVRH